MKLKPEETNKHLTTSCKDCVFAQYDGNTQTGCAADRLDLFRDQGYIIEAYDEEKEFYVIDCFCNYYRTPKWDGYDDGKANLQVAIDEIKPRVFISIYFDSPTSEKVNATLQSILSLDCDKSHIFISISQSHSNTTQEERHLSTHLLCRLSEEDINSKVMVNFSERMREYDLFRVAGVSSHIAMINIGDTIPSDLLVRLDEELNDKHKRIIFFDYQGLSIVMYSLFLSKYAEYFDYQAFTLDMRKESKKANMYMELVSNI
jgi:hypothetical protein